MKHVITAAIQATRNIIHHCFTLRRRFRNRLYLLPLCRNNQQVVSKPTAPLQDPNQLLQARTPQLDVVRNPCSEKGRKKLQLLEKYKRPQTL